MSERRIRFGFLLLTASFILITARLFQWQIINADKLKSAADKQHFSTLVIPASRGKIYSSDGFTLATNQEVYLLYAENKNIKDKPAKIAKKLAPLLVSEDPFLDMTVEEATKSGIKVAKPKEERIEATEDFIADRLSREDLYWVMLASSVSKKTKKLIAGYNIEGIGFEPIEERFYSEASASAHVLGFVGKDVAGQAKGYFGVEGFYDRELSGRDGKLIYEKDAQGRPILFGGYLRQKTIDGADIYLTIDQGTQKILEKHLKKGVERFEAKGGHIIVMEPTGAIVGMYSYPVYSLSYWQKYEAKYYRNPIVADSFEPGSIMKPLIMAAAVNEERVGPFTKCTKCSGPRNIGGYTIETFDGDYHPGSTMVKVLVNSDNTGMVFTAQELGAEKAYQYLAKFGLGQLTGVDLQEEGAGSLRPVETWREIDLATVSFGQGVAVTPLQMVTAFGVLAADGVLYRPYLVEKIVDKGRVITKKPEEVRKVIKSSTAKVLGEMLVKVARESPLADPFSKNSVLRKFRIAAKSGTAQIPIGGKYSSDRTIASVIGFAPVDKPRFVVLVTLVEPKANPWGANTAGPIFSDVLADLVTYFGVSP